MPKPLGMTADLRTVMPKGWQDEIWDAIQSAQAAGVTLEQLKKEVSDTWIQCLKQDIKYAEQQLRRW